MVWGYGVGVSGLGSVRGLAVAPEISLMMLQRVSMGERGVRSVVLIAKARFMWYFGVQDAPNLGPSASKHNIRT